MMVGGDEVRFTELLYFIRKRNITQGYSGYRTVKVILFEANFAGFLLM